MTDDKYISLDSIDNIPIVAFHLLKNGERQMVYHDIGVLRVSADKLEAFAIDILKSLGHHNIKARTAKQQ